MPLLPESTCGRATRSDVGTCRNARRSRGAGARSRLRIRCRGHGGVARTAPRMCAGLRSPGCARTAGTGTSAAEEERLVVTVVEGVARSGSRDRVRRERLGVTAEEVSRDLVAKDDQGEAALGSVLPLPELAAAATLPIWKRTRI